MGGKEANGCTIPSGSCHSKGKLFGRESISDAAAYFIFFLPLLPLSIVLLLFSLLSSFALLAVRVRERDQRSSWRLHAHTPCIHHPLFLSTLFIIMKSDVPVSSSRSKHFSLTHTEQGEKRQTAASFSHSTTEHGENEEVEGEKIINPSLLLTFHVNHPLPPFLLHFAATSSSHRLTRERISGRERDQIADHDAKQLFR